MVATAVAAREESTTGFAKDQLKAIMDRAGNE